MDKFPEDLRTMWALADLSLTINLPLLFAGGLVNDGKV